VGGARPQRRTWRTAILPGDSAGWRTGADAEYDAPLDEALVFAVDRSGRAGPTVRAARGALAAAAPSRPR
jgi:hypothetical protein